MRNRTLRLLQPAVRLAISQKPERRDHLLANLTAVGVPAPSAGLRMVRTYRSDSSQDVKKFLPLRGTTLSRNIGLRANEINDLPHASPLQL
jgi:hypothetical protein